MDPFHTGTGCPPAASSGNWQGEDDATQGVPRDREGAPFYGIGGGSGDGGTTSSSLGGALPSDMTHSMGLDAYDGAARVNFLSAPQAAAAPAQWGRQYPHPPQRHLRQQHQQHHLIQQHPEEHRYLLQQQYLQEQQQNNLQQWQSFQDSQRVRQAYHQQQMCQPQSTHPHPNSQPQSQPQPQTQSSEGMRRPRRAASAGVALATAALREGAEYVFADESGDEWAETAAAPPPVHPQHPPGTSRSTAGRAASSFHSPSMAWRAAVQGRFSASTSTPRASTADAAAAIEPPCGRGTDSRTSVSSSTVASMASKEGKLRYSATGPEGSLESTEKGHKVAPTEADLSASKQGGFASLSSSSSRSDEEGKDTPVAAECISLLMSSSSSSIEDGKEEMPKPAMKFKQDNLKDEEQVLSDRVSAALQKASRALSIAGRKKSGIPTASAASVRKSNKSLDTSAKNGATVPSVDAVDCRTQKASRALTKPDGKPTGTPDASVASVGKMNKVLDTSAKNSATVPSVDAVGDHVQKASRPLTKAVRNPTAILAASVAPVGKANSTLDALAKNGASALSVNAAVNAADGYSQKEARTLSKAGRKKTVIPDASVAKVGKKNTTLGTLAKNGARVLSVDAVDDRTGKIIQLSSSSIQGVSFDKRTEILAKKRTQSGQGKTDASQAGSDVSLRALSKVTDLEIASEEKKSKPDRTLNDTLTPSQKTTITHALFAGKASVPIGSPSAGPRKISHALFSGTVSLPSLSGADGGSTGAKKSSGGEAERNARFRSHLSDTNRLHRKRRRIFRDKNGRPSFVAAITITDSESYSSGSEDEEERKRRVELKRKSGRFVVDVDAILGLAPPPDKSPMYKRVFREMFLRKAAEEERTEVIPSFVSSSSAGGKIQRILAPPPGVWHTGVATLALPDRAEEERNVSFLHLFLRQNIELFSATEEDAAHFTGGRRTPVAVGRVGIRCIHCARAAFAGPPTQRRWAAGAISYPSNIAGIYPIVSQKPGLHFNNCPHLPAEQRAELRRITFDVDGQPKRQPRGSVGSNALRYYVYAAKRWGVVDATDGMRFGKDPKLGPFRAEEVNAANPMDAKSRLPARPGPVTPKSATSSTLTSVTVVPANISTLNQADKDARFL